MNETYNEALELESIKNKLKKYPKEKVISLIKELYADKKEGEAPGRKEDGKSDSSSPKRNELPSDSEEASQGHKAGVPMA